MSSRVFQSQSLVQLFVWLSRGFSAIAGDGGPNLRTAKRVVVAMFPWILNIYDPCHNLNLFIKDLSVLFKKDLIVVSGLSNYFGQSNYRTAHLNAERKKMNIKEGMKSASDTRFSTTYIQTCTVNVCMPAINSLYASGVLHKILQAYLRQTSAHYSFMSNLLVMIQLLRALVNGILMLEGQNMTCAKVFYVRGCIAWQLERVLANPMNTADMHRSQVINLYNTV
ncbi:hypothetical protein K438DRAFT_1905386 [Mycena galopus ATCC 62051]|nr:hypothetical protein K438DRAFT_1905386 [Mycena galopus ATCC 62051]